MMRFALFFLIMVLLVACSEGKKGGKEGTPAAPSAAVQPFVPTGSDEEQVQQIVRRYNQLLTEGYRTLNMTRLTEVTTQDQAEKAYIHMAAIGEGQARMLSTLKSIVFTGMKREQPDTFVVQTKEVWDFAYTDIKTGTETGRENNFVYEVTYTLKKTGPRWVIHDIVAYAPNDREEKRAPRSIRPTGDKPAAPVALPPGHTKIGP